MNMYYLNSIETLICNIDTYMFVNGLTRIALFDVYISIAPNINGTWTTSWFVTLLFLLNAIILNCNGCISININYVIQLPNTCMKQIIIYINYACFLRIKIEWDLLLHLMIYKLILAVHPIETVAMSMCSVSSTMEIESGSKVKTYIWFRTWKIIRKDIGHFNIKLTITFSIENISQILCNSSLYRNNNRM